MDSLQESTTTLQKDLKFVKDHLFLPLKKDQETAQNVPLCQVTRLYRLETLINIFSATIDAIQNYIEDEEMIEKTPADLMKSLAKGIEKESIHMNKYCTGDLSIVMSVAIQTNMGQEVEKQIATLHNHIEGLLKALKKSALEMKIAGVSCSNVQDFSEAEDYIQALSTTRFLDNKRRSAPSVSLNNNNTKETPRHKRGSAPAVSVNNNNDPPPLRRRMSFMGQGIVKTHEKHGQVNLDNTLIVDALLKQLPLKYDRH